MVIIAREPYLVKRRRRQKCTEWKEKQELYLKEVKIPTCKLRPLGSGLVVVVGQLLCVFFFSFLLYAFKDLYHTTKPSSFNDAGNCRKE